MSVYIGIYYGDTSNINHTLYEYWGPEAMNVELQLLLPCVTAVYMCKDVVTSPKDSIAVCWEPGYCSKALRSRILSRLLGWAVNARARRDTADGQSPTLPWWEVWAFLVMGR